MTRTGDRGRPFQLSAYPQTNLVQRYRVWAGVYVAGFFLLGSATLWLFNVRFG